MLQYLFDKVTGIQIPKRDSMVSPCEIFYILRAPILKNICERLDFVFLNFVSSRILYFNESLLNF